MAVDKLVDSAQLESDLTDVADAIRAKTGGTADLAFPADFVSEIGSISGGGDTVYYGTYGIPYAKNIVVPETVTTISGVAFYLCSELETISALGVTKGTAYLGGRECAKLRSVYCPRATTIEQYFIRQQNNSHNKLESVEVGSIGHPVTTLSARNWRYGSHAAELTVTIYVDASTLADIPSNVSNYANGNDAGYAPSGSTVTVIYKNSTTGEVITA